MTRIEAVVFDIGNVFLHWDPEGYYDRAIGRARREALFAEVDLDTMNRRSDMGEDIAALVAEYGAAHPRYAADIARWHTHWLEMAQPGIPETATLLRALRARDVPVFALTNFGVTTLAMAEERYPVLQEFDRRFVSGELRLMKPDPAIFALVETETGFAPDRLLFTDDRPENVEAAAARGWQVHLFDAPHGLARRLVAEGLLDAETGPGRP